MADLYVEPHTAALLARMGEDFAGGPADPSVDERRQGLAIAADLYGPPLAPVARVEDRLAANARAIVPVRLYWPLEPAAARPPVLLHIHGGGWVLGGPQAYERVARAYAEASGCLVVDVDYRRAPEHRHPVALDDCLAALDWIAREADGLGADGGRIFVTGDSAGGHLAALIAQRTAVPLLGQVLIYPVATASAHAQFESRQALGDGRWFLRAFDIERAEREYFADGDLSRETAGGSPLLASGALLARTPPALIITASLDPLRDEGEAYAQALSAAGVDVTFECVAGTIHGFVLFAGAIPLGRSTIQTVGAWLRARLR
jgi:acetyl esterase